MSSPNLGYLFWRECYKNGKDPDHIEKTITKILESRAKEELPSAPHKFGLTTTYPGLLIGSGYAHGLPEDADVKIGFYFDHTSGLPVIPGSSVKGVLRHLFGLPMQGKKDPLAPAKHAMIRHLLKNDSLDVPALAAAIFEGRLPNGDRLGSYCRDIFYDARIVDSRGEILADDYLAPHPDHFKNPIPIRFLKVAPEVTFAFAFRLVDTDLGDTVVTAREKMELFATMLSTFGVGAKTNVGYGRLENFQPLLSPQERERERQNEIRRDYEDAIASQTDKALERFILDHSDHPLAQDARKAIETLREKERLAHIEQAYNNLDKTKPQHISSFIEKYEKSPDAEEWVEKARALLEAKEAPAHEIDFSTIEEKRKLKEIENIVKNVIKTKTLSEEEKRMLEEAIANAKDLPKKRKKFPFGTFGNEKALGKERVNKLADRLGL